MCLCGPQNRADRRHWRLMQVPVLGTHGVWWWWWCWWLFPRLRGFWQNVRPLIPCLRFYFWFLEVEISSPALIPLFMPGSVHSGSASWDDWGRMFPDKFRVSSFPDRFPQYAWDFVGSKVYACLGVSCHLHFWQNDRGLLRATAVARGWSGHRTRVSIQSWLWRRKFSRRSCRDSNSQPFDDESGALTKKLSRLSRNINRLKHMPFRCCLFTASWTSTTGLGRNDSSLYYVHITFCCCCCCFIQN